MNLTAIRKFTAAAFCFAGAAFAAAAPVSLAEARKIAIEKSQTVRQAEIGIASSKQSERSAFADFLPSLSANGGYSIAFPGGSSVTATPSVGLSAGQTLFSGGAKVNALKSARLQSAQAEETLRASRLSVIAETDARYLGALKAERTYETAVKDLEAAEKRLEIAKAKRAAGTLADTDYLQTQASWSTKRTAATQSKWAAEASRRKLDSYLGTNTEIEPLDDAEYGALAAAVRKRAETDLDSLVKSLYAKGRAADPDMRKKEAAVMIADIAVKTKSAAFFPSLSVSASLKGTIDAASEFSTDQSFSISASVPLFPISGRSSAAEIAKLNSASAASQVSSAEEELLLSFYTTTVDILSAAGQIESADAALEYAEQNHKLALEKFRLGSGAVSDLTDAEATLATARAQTTNARFDLYAAVTKLSRLLGAEEERGLADALP